MYPFQGRFKFACTSNAERRQALDASGFRWANVASRLLDGIPL